MNQQLELFAGLHSPAPDVEPFHTVPQAAQALGIKKHMLRRAIAGGLIPYYTPFDSTRRLVKLSEVRAVIEQHRNGGQDHG